MSSLVGSSPDVYPLVEQWSFNVSLNGINGTRVYLETTETLSGSTQPLPNIGASWSTDYPLVILRSIDVSFLGGVPTCGKKYICNYDDTPNTQTSSGTTADEAPISIDVAGEFWAWEPKDGSWKWASDNTEIKKQNVNKKVALASFKLYRVVKAINDYMPVVFELMNRVNSTYFRGFVPGTVLFTGCNATEFKNRAGNKRWRCELVFQVRAVTMSATPQEDGWNYIIREDNGQWDKPYRVPGTALTTPIYGLPADFSFLFSTQPLGPDEDLYNAFPDS